MINSSTTTLRIMWTRKVHSHVNLSLVYFVFYNLWSIGEWRVQRVAVVDFFPKNFPAAQKISLINLCKGRKSLKNQLAHLFFRICFFCAESHMRRKSGWYWFCKTGMLSFFFVQYHDLELELRNSRDSVKSMLQRSFLRVLKVFKQFSTNSVVTAKKMVRSTMRPTCTW